MQKGGVGKTTTTINLATALAQRGHQVLVIDSDPQANATTGLGCDPETCEYSIYEVLLNPEHGVGFATLTTAFGVDLVPSTLALAGAELELAGKIGRELLLRKALRATARSYEYVLIDPPPSLGLFTLNALVAAETVIVPLQLHAYALNALPQLKATIQLVQDLNPTLAIGASSVRWPTGGPCSAGSLSNRPARPTATWSFRRSSRSIPRWPNRRPPANPSWSMLRTAREQRPILPWRQRWRLAMARADDLNRLLGGKDAPPPPPIRRGRGGGPLDRSGAGG
jgi:hypothetical protein